MVRQSVAALHIRVQIIDFVGGLWIVRTNDVMTTVCRQRRRGGCGREIDLFRCFCCAAVYHTYRVAFANS